MILSFLAVASWPSVYLLWWAVCLGQQRMWWWLDDITDSVDMNLSKFLDVVKVRGIWHVQSMESQIWTWHSKWIKQQLFASFAHFYVMNCIFKEIFDHSKIQWKGQKCPVHPLPPHMYKLPHYQRPSLEWHVCYYSCTYINSSSSPKVYSVHLNSLMMLYILCFGQVFNYVYPHYIIILNIYSAIKITSTFLPSVLIPDNHWSLNCFHSFGFSKYLGRNYRVCVYNVVFHTGSVHSVECL